MVSETCLLKFNKDWKNYKIGDIVRINKKKLDSALSSGFFDQVSDSVKTDTIELKNIPEEDIEVEDITFDGDLGIRFLVNQSYIISVILDQIAKKDEWSISLIDGSKKYFEKSDIINSSGSRERFAKMVDNESICDKKKCLNILNVIINHIQKIKFEENRPVPEYKEDEDHKSFFVSGDDIVETVYDPRTEKISYLIYNKKEGEYFTAEDFSGKKPYDDDLVKKGVILMPSDVIEYGTTKELYSEIQEFIHTYLEVDPFYEKLAAYYVMFSWVYDCFNTLPYLRALGDYGSGKSRFLITIGYLCYKPVFGSGATTTSPVFRIIDKYRGTLIVDEGDIKKSDEDNEMIKILNCGYEKTMHVLRSGNAETNFEPQAFSTFCPKIISTRKEFDDRALESRCLTHKMLETSRDDIPIILPQKFFEDALSLRNKLLLFRFKNWGKIDLDYSMQDNSIEKRLNQIILPIFSMINDEEMRIELKEFMKDYNKTIISDRGEQREYQILSAIYNVMNQEGIEEDNFDKKIHLKKIAEIINDEELKSRKVSWYLRKKLFIETHKDMEGAFITNSRRMTILFKKYGIVISSLNNTKNNLNTSSLSSYHHNNHDDMTSMTVYIGTKETSSYSTSDYTNIERKEDKSFSLDTPKTTSLSSYHHKIQKIKAENIKEFCDFQLESLGLNEEDITMLLKFGLIQEINPGRFIVI